jgi:hypothetical protein
MSVTNQAVRDVLGRRIRDRRRSLGKGLRRIAGESALAPALAVEPCWFFRVLE